MAVSSPPTARRVDDIGHHRPASGRGASFAAGARPPAPATGPSRRSAPPSWATHPGRWRAPTNASTRRSDPRGPGRSHGRSPRPALRRLPRRRGRGRGCRPRASERSTVVIGAVTAVALDHRFQAGPMAASLGTGRAPADVGLVAGPALVTAHPAIDRVGEAAAQPGEGSASGRGPGGGRRVGHVQSFHRGVGHGTGADGLEARTPRCTHLFGAVSGGALEVEAALGEPIDGQFAVALGALDPDGPASELAGGQQGCARSRRRGRARSRRARSRAGCSGGRPRSASAPDDRRPGRACWSRAGCARPRSGWATRSSTGPPSPRPCPAIPPGPGAPGVPRCPGRPR